MKIITNPLKSIDNYLHHYFQHTYYRTYFLLRKLFPKHICQGYDGPCCRLGKRRRMNTQYLNEESNWCVACDDCFEAIEAEWAERWDEYYRGCM